MKKLAKAAAWLAIVCLSFGVLDAGLFAPVAKAAVTVIHVANYGAVPNDGTDDGEAIRTAIDEAVRTPGGAEVVFATGRYLVGPPPREWRFDTDGSLDGWTLANQLSGTVSGGVLTLAPSGTDPYMISPGALAIDGNRFFNVRIHMKNNTAATSATIWWTTQDDAAWSVAKSETFPIKPNDAGFTEYTVDLSYHPKWAGNMIKKLRLDPENGAGSGTIEIDSIWADVATAAEWKFDTDGDAEGWTALGGSGLVAGGRYQLTVAAGDSAVLSPEYLSLHAERYGTLKLRIKNNTSTVQGKISYITDTDPVWDDKKSKTFAISAGDADVKEYVIPLDSLYYNGIVRQIRIEPAAGAASGTVEIDSVRFEPQNPLISNFYFHYKGATGGLTLRGNNTELMFADPFYGAFKFQDSSGIAIKGFTVDYEKPPFTQGVITACNGPAATVDFAPDAGYGYILDDPRTALMPSRWGVVRDPSNFDLQKEAAPNLVTVQSWEKLGTNAYRLQLPSYMTSKVCASGYIEQNDKFAFSYRGTGFNVFDLRNDSNISIEGVTVYKGAGTTITGQNLEGYVTVDNLNVLRRTPDQVMTTPADGIHIQFSVNGPVVRNSTFEGMLDDAINFYQHPSQLIEAKSPTQIYAKISGIYAIGDTIQVFDPRTGRIRGTAVIVGMVPVNGFELKSRAILTLDRAIPGMTGGDDMSTADSIFNLTKNFQNYEVSGSTFRESRRYGVLVRPGSGGVIRNNTFTDLGGAGIAVQNEPGPFAYEGPMAEQLTIEGNTFNGNNYLNDINSAAKGGKLTASGIQIFGEKADKQVSDSRGIRGITILNNTIRDPIRNAILIAGADTVTFAGANTITTAAGVRTLDGDIAAIKLENAANVTIDGVSITDPRPELNAAIQVGTAVERLTVGGVTYSLASGVPGTLKLASEAPAGLTATGRGSGVIELDWTDMAGANTYNVYRGTTPDFAPSWETKIACCADSRYWDTGLAPSTSYYYKVTAVNAASYESAASVAAMATTLQAPFADDFEDGNFLGWTASGTGWSVVQDGTKVLRQSDSIGEYIAIADGTSASDSVIEARIKMTDEGPSSTGSGIVFRYADGDNYYWLNLRRPDNKLRLMKKSGNVWSQVYAAALPQSLNSWYSVKIEAFGGSIRAYVNGAKLVDVTDSGPASGKAGVRVYNTATNVDDFKVQFGAPLPNLIPAPFVDGFEDGNASNWQKSGSGVWSVVAEGGTYAYDQSSVAGEAISWHDGTSAANNYVAEAKIKLTGVGTDASGTGLAFRRTDNNNYYWLNLKVPSNELRLMKKVGGTWSQIGSTIPFPLPLNEWHRVKVVVECDSIKAYVNGAKVFDVMDGSLPAGGIGFRSFKTSARFDDVTVTNEIPPEPVTSTPPGPTPPVYLLYDDFEDGDTAGWTTSGASWKLAPDVTLVYAQSGASGEAVSSAGNAAWTDYTVQARVKMTAENGFATGAGLVFRMTDDNHYYWLNLRRPDGQLRLMKKDGQTWSQIANVPLPQQLTTWYTLKAVLNGNSIKCYVNGVEKINVTDSSMSAGKIGLRTYGTDAEFDYVTVE